MRPGLKTSEFYTSQVSAGGLLTVVLSEPDWRVKSAALLALGILQAGYAVSRGLEKKGGVIQK